MDCVAVGWLVWVTWLVGYVGTRSVHEVFAGVAVLGYSVDRCVAVLGGIRGLAVVGVSCGWVGALSSGCCLCGCRRLACVKFIGWCLFGVGID